MAMRFNNAPMGDHQHSMAYSGMGLPIGGGVGNGANDPIMNLNNQMLPMQPQVAMNRRILQQPYGIPGAGNIMGAHGMGLNQQRPTCVNVWKSNLEATFRLIRELISQYPVISVNTEFPGIIARPIGTFKSTTDYHYQTMRTNGDIINLIQLGLSLTDENGNRPEGIESIWQFNFSFDRETDMYSADMIEQLINSGVNLKQHKEEGIDHFTFVELLYDSGLVLQEDVKWLSFHGGYDFGFIISLLINRPLPSQEDDFLWWLNAFFPNVYDVKHISRVHNRELQGGPTDLADSLGIPHLNLMTPGYHAVLAGLCFFELKKRYFPDGQGKNFRNQIFGLSKKEDSSVEQPGLAPSIGIKSQPPGLSHNY